MKIVADSKVRSINNKMTESETSMMNSQCNLNVCVADVTDSEQVSEIFKRYRPAVVFHTAAYKHLNILELY